MSGGPGSAVPTLMTYTPHFLAQCRRRVAHRATVVLYERVLRRHVTPAWGAVPTGPLAAITAADVRALITVLRERGMARGYAGLTLRVLRVVFREAQREGLVAVNPAVAAWRELTTALGYPHQRRPPVITAAEAPGFLAVCACREPSHYPLFATMLGARLRLGVALGLQVDDVDLEAGVLHVRRAWGRPRGIPGPVAFPCRPRRVVLVPELVALLARQTAQVTLAVAALGWAPTPAWLFRNPRTGGPFSPRTMEDARTRLRERARAAGRGGLPC